MKILGIDPGANAGWALFDGPHGSESSHALARCGVLRPPYVLPEGLAGVDVLVIEKPHPGDARASKADLIKLASRMGQLIGLVRARETVEVLPGGIPKAIRNKRTIERLTFRERAAVDRAEGLKKGSKAVHNTLDAIWHVLEYCKAHGMRGAPGAL